MCRNSVSILLILSNSGLLVADNAVMLKTCGTTVVAACDIHSTTTHYSPVHIEHPGFQPLSNTSLVDEVKFELEAAKLI